jgi:hypothetical protein
MQETDGGMEAGHMVVCAAATAGIVRAAGSAATQQQQQQQQRLQAGALAVLSDILAPHAAATAIASGGEAAVPAAAAAATSPVIGAIEGVSEEWHASGYFSNPRQVDSALHLDVVQPGSGAKVPVAVANFLVPAAAARGSATGRLLASSASDSVSPALAAAGVSSASYIITSDDDYSSAGSGLKGGRVPGRRSGMAAGAGELVLVIDGLQTKVPRQADLARQQRAARRVSQQQQQQEGRQAAAVEVEGEEDYPCSYELDWQLSEPSQGKLAAAAAAAGEGLIEDTVRHAGKLTVLMHEEPETEAATAQAVQLQLQLNADSTPAAAAATALALLQQVNQLQANAAAPVAASSTGGAAAAAAAFALQTELSSSGSKLGPGEGLQSSTAAAADATSAVWGLLRTEATEQTGITVNLIDSDSLQPATSDSQHPASMQAAAAGTLEAVAVRAAAVHVPRLLPVLRPEAAEHLVIQPEPRSSLSNLVARAADISQVGRSRLCCFSDAAHERPETSIKLQPYVAGEVVLWKPISAAARMCLQQLIIPSIMLALRLCWHLYCRQGCGGIAPGMHAVPSLCCRRPPALHCASLCRACRCSQGLVKCCCLSKQWASTSGMCSTCWACTRETREHQAAMQLV